MLVQLCIGSIGWVMWKIRKDPLQGTYRFTTVVGTIAGSYDRLEIHSEGRTRTRETWLRTRSYVMPLCDWKVQRRIDKIQRQIIASVA